MIHLLAAISYALTLVAQPAEPASQLPPWTGSAGRVYTTSNLHIGLRPAATLAYREWGVGTTCQFTVRTPW